MARIAGLVKMVLDIDRVLLEAEIDTLTEAA